VSAAQSGLAEAAQVVRTAEVRSWLYVPGDRPDRFDKAVTSKADGVILDLEDAVAPEQKGEARAQVLAFLATRPACAIAVRINPLERLIGLEDLALLARAKDGPIAILIPKAEDQSMIRLADHLLRDGGSASALMALIESARGVVAVANIAQSTPRLAALMFGAADYAADLGQQEASFRADHARAAIVNAAALAGLAAIDSPCFAVKDSNAVKSECASARNFGFFGKAAIHPSQITEINICFRPTEAEIAHAKRVVALSSGGVITIDGKMIDMAMLRSARRIAPIRT